MQKLKKVKCSYGRIGESRKRQRRYENRSSAYREVLNVFNSTVFKGGGVDTRKRRKVI